MTIIRSISGSFCRGMSLKYQVGMNTVRASPEQLETCIGTFVGSGHSHYFHLACKYCRDLGKVSATRRTISNPKALRKAAAAFAVPLALRTSSRPSAASPRMAKRSYRVRQELIPLRTTGWSSTNSSFIRFFIFSVRVRSNWMLRGRLAHSEGETLKEAARRTAAVEVAGGNARYSWILLFLPA